MNHGHRHGDRQAQQNAHVEGLGLQRESAEAQTGWGGSWRGAERGGQTDKLWSVHCPQTERPTRRPICSSCQDHSRHEGLGRGCGEEPHFAELEPSRTRGSDK